MKRTCLFFLLLAALILALAACSSAAPATAADASAEAKAPTKTAALAEATAAPTIAPTPAPTPTPVPTPTPKPFHMGVLTENLYRSDYLGLEIPFGQMPFQFDDNIIPRRMEGTIVRNAYTTDEQINGILAKKDQYYVDLSVSAYSITNVTSITVAFCQADSSRYEDAFITANLGTGYTDTILDQTTLNIGDLEWEVVDHYCENPEWELGTIYDRVLTCCQGDVCAVINMCIHIEWGTATYEQAKPNLDKLSNLVLPIDPDAPVPTSAPMPTPTPKPLTLVAERNESLEKDGLSVSAQLGVKDNADTFVLTFMIDVSRDTAACLGFPVKWQIRINGVALPMEYRTPTTVEPGGNRFSITVSVANTSLAGIDIEDIQEIQIPLGLYNDTNYKFIKDYGTLVLKPAA